MKKYQVFVFIIISFSALNSNLKAQKNSDTLIVTRKLIPEDSEPKGEYAKSVFKFFDFNTKQQIRLTGGITINGVLVFTDASGEVKLFLAKSTYSVKTRAIGWKDTKIFKFNIELQYAYEIHIYLTQDKEPIAQNSNTIKDDEVLAGVKTCN